jgi:preprotein translocase subunit SecD
VVNSKPDIDAKDIDSIQLTEDSAPLGIKQKVFAFTLTASGSKKLEDLTQNHIGDTLLIYLGNEVLAAPVIKSSISGGRFIFSPPQTSGKNFTLRDFCSDKNL